MHGLAASIRNADDNETFDLAGKNASTIQNAIQEAFQEPFDQSRRITFVTGAGKLARQKYDDDAAKTITTVLKSYGYEDDAGGGDGTFKLQHDTGKNLKTVVVHPKTTTSNAEKDLQGISLQESKPLLDEKSHEYKLVHTSVNTFSRVIESQCVSWSQKRNCIDAIEAIKGMLQELDQKLLTGTPLEEVEQDFYDSISVKELEEKEGLVREQMHKLVEDGQIMPTEKEFLLSQVQSKVDTIDAELANTKGDAKKKKLEQVKEKATERKEKLKAIQPIEPHKLKNQPEINKLRKELAPLLEIEKNAKGRLFTVKETQSMARKEEIEEEIQQLEESSRGWFESDEEFAIRLEASRKVTATSSKGKSTASKPASTIPLPKPNTATKWITPGSRKPAPKSAATKSKSAPRGGGVFAAMMMDSDSD